MGDLVYTFDRILGKTEAGDIGALGSKASYYGGVTAVEALDTYTVQFTLAEPNAAFLSTLTSNYGAIVDKDVIEENGDLMRADGGTGPVGGTPVLKADLRSFDKSWVAALMVVFKSLNSCIFTTDMTESLICRPKSLNSLKSFWLIVISLIQSDDVAFGYSITQSAGIHNSQRGFLTFC